MGDALGDYYALIDGDDPGSSEPFPCLCEECVRELIEKEEMKEGDDD